MPALTSTNTKALKQKNYITRSPLVTDGELESSPSPTLKSMLPQNPTRSQTSKLTMPVWLESLGLILIAPEAQLPVHTKFNSRTPMVNGKTLLMLVLAVMKKMRLNKQTVKMVNLAISAESTWIL